MLIIRYFKNIKILLWTFSLMLVGFALGQKGHYVEYSDMLFSSGIGALSGFIIGVVIVEFSKKKKN